MILPFGSELQKKSITLRDELLRKPLGLHFTAGDLAQEENEFHLALVSTDTNGNQQVDAILLLKPTGEAGVIKMRQVATRETMQGQGLGTMLVQKAEDFALDNGFFKMELNARETAVPFYKNRGYRIVSERFTEVNIPHFKMEKNLRA